MGEGKNMILYILALVLIDSITAITWSNKLPRIPPEFGNKTGCYIRELNDVIPFNDSVNALGYCYLIHCTVKQIDYVSCGVTSVVNDSMECHIAEAQTDAPYPRCCPMVKCYESHIPWESTNRTSKYDYNDEHRKV